MYKWTSVCAIAFSLLTSSSNADDIDSLLLFGDSYFDTGAGNAIATSLAIPLPNPTPPYFNNRHSNGPIWIDYTKRHIDLPFVDFGVAGAETGTENFSEPPLGGINTQIQRYIGTMPPISSRVLTIMDGGGNDYFTLLNDPSMLNPAGVAAVTEQALTNQAVNLVTLQTIGAKKIVIWNLGNLGMLPLFTDPALGLTVLAPLFTAASEAFNAGLITVVKTLNRQSTSHKQIYIFDAFAVFNEVAAELQAMGINLTEHTITTLPDGSFIITGPQPGHLAFYDQVHPTTLAWSIFAKHMSAYLDTLIDGPRFIAAEQDLAFETSRAFRDAMDNHYRTMHFERFIQCRDWSQCCNLFDRLEVYLDGLAKWGSTRARQGTLGLNYDTQLIMIGADYHHNERWTFGANFTAQRNYGRVKSHDRHHGHMELNDWIPTIYAEYGLCNFFIDSNLSYHIYDFRRIRRRIPFLNETARARVRAQGVEYNVEAGYVLPCRCSTFIPIIGLDYEYLHIRKYRERHAPDHLNFRMHRQHNDSLVGKIGGQMFWNPFECGPLTFGELYLESEFLRHRRTLSPRRIDSNDGSRDFNRTSSPDRFVLKYSVGVDSQLTTNVSGNISYQGETTFRRYNNAVRAEIYATF